MTKTNDQVKLPEPEAILTKKINKDGRIFLGSDFKENWVYFIVNPEIDWKGLNREKRIPQINNILIDGTEVGVKMTDDKGRLYVGKKLRRRWCSVLIFSNLNENEVERLKEEVR